MHRIIAPNMLLTVFASLFVLGSAASVRAEQCSVATLNGSFGYTGTGTLVSESGAVPFASVGQITFDGQGNFTTIRTISQNGTVSQGVQGGGTYTVNPDCTGTLTFIEGITPSQGTDIVIDDNGNEVRAIATNPGTVVTTIGRKQFSG